MCGIVGYLGNRNSKEILLDGLAELEYRGYDSAGISIITENKTVHSHRAVGKLKNLRQKCEELVVCSFTAGIGHTRWATHGKPTENNAHPHFGTQTHIVHNGIIENYQELKTALMEKGVSFRSQTDTEVFVHLFEQYLKEGEPFEAFKAALKQIEGAYAILLITQADPGRIFFAKHGSPMIMGRAEGEHFFASSDAALIGLCEDVHFLEDGEYGYVSADTTCICNSETENVMFENAKLPLDKLSAQKEGYRFFMEKEIYEQAEVLADTLRGRIQGERVHFDELEKGFFNGINEIKLCACGTSYHAALAASYLFERLAKIRVSVEIASEFRYKEPLLLADTLFVVVSQSGETADTLEALKMAKNAGLKSLAICNVDNSSIVRLCDATLLTRAGMEKGVASTKAFATQVMVFWLLALECAQQRNILDEETLKRELRTLREVPQATLVSEAMHEQIKRLSKRYLHGHGFFFIGRDVFYPLALEGALKLKEISYLHAEGYPAGEMKHGPIALADPELFTIALLSEKLLFEKTKSNIEELGARDATICSVSSYVCDKADDRILLQPREHYMLEFYEMMVATQLLALEVSVRLGNDVDMPRNLAKSVTVE